MFWGCVVQANISSKGLAKEPPEVMGTQNNWRSADFTVSLILSNAISTRTKTSPMHSHKFPIRLKEPFIRIE